MFVSRQTSGQAYLRKLMGLFDKFIQLCWVGFVLIALAMNYQIVTSIVDANEYRIVVDTTLRDGPLEYEMNQFTRQFIHWLNEKGHTLDELDNLPAKKWEQLVSEYQIHLFKEKE